MLKIFVLGVTLRMTTQQSPFAPVPEEPTPQEQTIWKLEHLYWEYVKELDIENYRALWHHSFVGWPHLIAEPVRKKNISDWITQAADQGLRLTSFVLRPAAAQAIDNLITVHYWITVRWAGKNVDEPPVRVTHTWLREENSWLIIAGMSCPEPNPPR